ncbi:phosphoribosylformylglycinamidine synthase isoform X3 [Octopus sinensis]|nr:phosphoribosylformylglycinamidine synthase isoform X3 [Octopus sinensis]
MAIICYYQHDALSAYSQQACLAKLKASVPKLTDLETEICYYVSCQEKEISLKDEEKLTWILSKPFCQKNLRKTSFFGEHAENCLFVEIGPRLNFSTPFSTNAVSICRSVGLQNIDRIEVSVAYLLKANSNETFSKEEEEKLVALLHDKMTQCRYMKPLETFELKVKTEAVYEIDVLKEGQKALEKANADLGLAFDQWDLEYYTKLFQEKIQRNPTSVECFDLAQSNSEHSRHWFFKGIMILDGEIQTKSLFRMVMDTQDFSNNNSIIKFNDNSSAIDGFEVSVLLPEDSSKASPFVVKEKQKRHIIFTAETHNFPTGVAPFPGATTGTGGRIRDVHCTGRGAHVVAGTAGYSFGNLNIPGYVQPWEEEKKFDGPVKFASALDVAIEASNGASDYGNKFGEPVLAGFARSFGLCLPNGEWKEYVKPIMFSAGIGMLEDMHIKKQVAEEGMEVVKIGGPVYRIGVGGGAASSVEVQGDNKSDLDFNAVQRGDAEMEQKLNRLIRSCIELKEGNPILSIHDQGAGGNGNVLKELVEPAGAEIFADNFILADPTISALELWGAEYQESNALLLMPKDHQLLEKISQRERCPVSFVGRVTGDGKIKLNGFSSTSDGCSDPKRFKDILPVNLDLKHVLGSMPQKNFKLDHLTLDLKPLSLPIELTLRESLERVLRLPAVASKRYLTNKVDRSVTGLVAQQQCVGYLHTPLSDVAVTALSYFDTVGSATAIGEQPIKGLVNPCCGARMSVGESLTNLIFAPVTALKDVKCSSNWMWAAKLAGEGAALYDACKSMCDIMKQLGIAVDGGKDSLSMAARVGSQTIKAPGTLVVSTYVGCPDIRLSVTPDLKCSQGRGILLHVDPSCGQHRIGGSALAQCFKQLGKDVPDLERPDIFKSMFDVTQQCISDRLISSGHDISDGGLITCALEMAFAGNCSMHLHFENTANDPPLELLFAEELGLILELRDDNQQMVISRYKEAGVPCSIIGYCSEENVPKVTVSVSNQELLNMKLADLRDIWEETSYQLEKRQTTIACAEAERKSFRMRKKPRYTFNYDLSQLYNPHSFILPQHSPSIAIIREEGSNGDREMAAAFHYVGFQTWDVNMQDLCSGNITLDQFRGIAFVGGFSYADVCGSAKGWAATAMFNKNVKEEFKKFFDRDDTFSFGVCNGCQLMSLLGWVAPYQDDSITTVLPLDHSVTPGGLFLDANSSERFESRFVTAKVSESPAIMFEGMAGTVFGIWVSHGEGKMQFKSDSLYRNLKDKQLIPLHYVNDDGIPTSEYPFNPNGSPDGVAAVCSENGRHVAIMPHPERCFLAWQCPWLPLNMCDDLQVTPWLKLFANAYNWCQTIQ